MNVGELMKYISENKVDAEVILHKGKSGLKSEDAALVHGVPVEQIIKVLLFVGEKGKAAAAIVQGNCRVDPAKLGLQKPRFAKPEQVKEMLDYAPGSVPPICLDVPVLVDNAVLSLPYVFGSACNEFAGLKINPQELLKHNRKVQAADIKLLV